MEFWHRVCQTFSIHLPFVLSSAPFIFTRLLKPLETQWRRQGIPIAIFFDDGIGAGSPLNSAKINSSIVRADLSHCSLEIHKEKFNWEPERKFSWIGYNLDAKTRLSFASCGPLAVEMSHKSWPGICKIFNLEGNDHLKNSPSIPLKVVWSVGEFATTQVKKCREDRSSW